SVLASHFADPAVTLNCHEKEILLLWNFPDVTGCRKQTVILPSSRGCNPAAGRSPLCKTGMNGVPDLWAYCFIANVLESSIVSASYTDFGEERPPVIKLDIINAVVTKIGITKTQAELAVETVFESMKQALAKGERIELRGFGVFNVRPRKTGIGRNPRTGAEVNIPPGKAVRFKPGKELQSIH